MLRLGAAASAAAPVLTSVFMVVSAEAVDAGGLSCPNWEIILFRSVHWQTQHACTYTRTLHACTHACAFRLPVLPKTLSPMISKQTEISSGARKDGLGSLGNIIILMSSRPKSRKFYWGYKYLDIIITKINESRWKDSKDLPIENETRGARSEHQPCEPHQWQPRDGGLLIRASGYSNSGSC